MANSLFSVGLEKHGPPRPFPFLRGYLLLAAAQQGLPGCSGQCVRGPWFLEQRLLKKCKYRFIALRSFVICVITPQQGEGNQIIISTARKTSGAALVPLCSAGGWIPSAGPWSSNSAEGREGGETATTEGWRDGLNSQTASHLVELSGSRNYHTCLCFACSQTAADGFSTASGAALRAGMCWDVLGPCWLGHVCFFLCCNWVCPPVSQEGNKLPYQSRSPDH